MVLSGTPGAGNIASDQKTHFETAVHRLAFMQPTFLGTFSGGLSYTDKRKHYFTQRNGNGDLITNPNSSGKNVAFNIQDEVELFDAHTFVVGLDSLDYYVTFAPREDDDNRVRSQKAGFIEDTWQITERLSARAGLRYETVDLSIANYSAVAGWGSVPGYQVTLDPPRRYIEKDYDQWIQKFFLSYDLDDHAACLRDTSVSLGVSKFWNVAPFCLVCPGRYAQVDPEHGMNYDLIVNRRLWGDIQLKVDYSYYRIKDYVANNWDYADYYYSDPTVPAGLEGSDMYINLDEVIRHGLEVELNGNLTNKLSFYVGYCFQDFIYDGDEPAGKELGDVAKHRINAGLRYKLHENTLVMVDYKFQDEQIAHEIVESPKVRVTMFRTTTPCRPIMCSIWVSNIPCTAAKTLSRICPSDSSSTICSMRSTKTPRGIP